EKAGSGTVSDERGCGNASRKPYASSSCLRNRLAVFFTGGAQCCARRKIYRWATVSPTSILKAVAGGIPGSGANDANGKRGRARKLENREAVLQQGRETSTTQPRSARIPLESGQPSSSRSSSASSIACRRSAFSLPFSTAASNLTVPSLPL